MLEAHDVAEAQSRGIPQFLAALRQRLGKDRMELWFGSQVLWQVTFDRKLQILVSSGFISDCILRMFRQDLRSVVSEVFGDGWGFELQIASPAPPESPTGNKPVEISLGKSSDDVRKSPRIAYDGAVEKSIPKPHSTAPFVNAIPVAIHSQPASPEDVQLVEEHSVSGPLRLVGSESTTAADREIDRLVALRREQERRWDDFIVGPHNNFAWTACQMVLERPGQVSPFLIHGPHGVGKTHLAVALSQRLKAQQRYRRVIFLTGEQFTIEYTENAKSGGFASFRKKYRDVEVLVIDDVQFCLGKQGTLIELRNTIDMLLRESRQVILVSDRGLHELDGLGHDLHARLSGGMHCAIEPMDPHTRRALLSRLCNQHGLGIDQTC
jgi:chromosomal replication initiation ATPase DnaA